LNWQKRQQNAGIDMDGDLVDVFRQAGSVRLLDNRTLQRMRAAFKSRMSALLKSDVRCHPLGFFYATERVSSDYTFRYHLWPKGWAMPLSQAGSEIHDHIFELNSVIVAGEMLHETFRFVPREAGPFRLIQVKYGESGAALAPSDNRGDLFCSRKETMTSGTIYRLPVGVLHRATPLIAPTATVVLAIAASEQMPRIVVRNDQSLPQNYVRSLLDKKQADAAKREIDSI
jgi:hypothetical protein